MSNCIKRKEKKTGFILINENEDKPELVLYVNTTSQASDTAQYTSKLPQISRKAQFANKSLYAQPFVRFYPTPSFSIVEARMP